MPKRWYVKVIKDKSTSIFGSKPVFAKSFLLVSNRWHLQSIRSSVHSSTLALSRVSHRRTRTIHLRMGGHHSSVDSSAPTISNPGFESQAHHLLKSCTILVIVLRKRDQNRQKEVGFDSYLFKIKQAISAKQKLFGWWAVVVAQLVERSLLTPEVRGLNPALDEI